MKEDTAKTYARFKWVCSWLFWAERRSDGQPWTREQKLDVTLMLEDWQDQQSSAAHQPQTPEVRSLKSNVSPGSKTCLSIRIIE